MLHFYHKDTLREIIALKEYLLNREEEGTIDNVDAWIRMVAINRLTGHSSGFSRSTPSRRIRPSRLNGRRKSMNNETKFQNTAQSNHAY